MATASGVTLATANQSHDVNIQAVNGQAAPGLPDGQFTRRNVIRRPAAPRSVLVLTTTHSQQARNRESEGQAKSQDRSELRH